MKVTVEGTHNPHPSEVVEHDSRSVVPLPPQYVEPHYSETEPLVSDSQAGPKPIGTLVVVAILLLVTTAFWMMVLGIQQGRA